MKRTLPFALALAATLTSLHAHAQAPAAGAAAAPAAAPATPVQAGPSKVAIIAFEQVVMATNEGQRALADINAKYDPQKKKLQTEGEEIEALQKKVQALPASTTDEQRATLLRELDTKQKHAQSDAEEASNSYQGEISDAINKLAPKVGQAAVKYAQANGFTLILNNGGNQQAPSPVLWFELSTDISQAVVNAYNASSGVAAPPPAAPAATHRATPAAPASSTPKKAQ